jgi:ElaB/YqjD/DUF883 family membrane-anchored ribosome-binding protein
MDRTADELKQQLEAQREEVGRDLVVIGDRISPSRIAERGQARMRRRVTMVRDRVMGTVDDGRSRLGDTASGISSGVGDTASGIADSARHAPQQVTERVEGNPLAAGLVAFGIGLLAGSMLPGTRREEELAQQAQPVLEQAAGSAADTAREVVEDLRPAAEEELDALKQEAKGAAQATTSTAKEQAQQARGEMTQASS